MSYDEFENLIRSIFGGMYTNAARWFEDFSRISGDEFQNSATQIALQSLQDAKMGTLRLLQNDVLNQIESGSQFISMPPLVEELRNDPAQAEIYGSVIDYFDRLFNGDQAVERNDILTNDEFFVIGAGLASNTSTSPSGDFGWSVTNQGQIDRYSTLRDTYQTERQDYLERAEVYGDALFDQLQLQEGLRDDFDNWWEGYIEGGVARMPQAIFDAVYDNQGPTIQQAIGTLGTIQDFDITNMPASGGASNQVDQVLTEGTDLRDEPVNTDSNTTSDQDITNLPAGGTDDTTTGTTMEEFSLIRIGNIVYRAYPVPGSNAPRLEPAQPGDVDIGGGTYENPNTVYENWDDFIYGGVLDTDARPGDSTQGQSSDEGNLLDQAINFIQTLLGGGGGSMSQDQAQVLQNVLRDLIDFEVGDISATTGDQQTDVDVQTDVDASSDVDVLAEGGMSDVDIGPQSQTTTTDVDIGATDIDLTPTQTTTIEEGAIQNAPVFTDAVSVSDLISEGAFDVGGGQATVGNVTTGPSTATVGNIDVGDSTATIEEGAIQNMPVFTDAVSVSDIISEGAFSDLISEGALSAQGGAGGAGGAGGTSTSTAQGGSVSNVFDTAGIGTAIGSLGDTLGGFGGDVLDFLGNFLGGQQSTEGQVSENTLAGILAQEAANRYIADKAAESQQNILDFQKKQYDEAIARLQPFYNMGVTQAQEVLPEYIDAAKRDIEYVDIDPFDADDPALRFLQDEARRAIENSAAARGRLNTGGTLTDLQDRSANIALARAGELVGIRDRMNQEERLRDEYDFNKLGRLVGGAQNAANVMTGSDQYYSGLMSPYAESMYEIDAGESARRSQNYYNIFKDLFGI